MSTRAIPTTDTTATSITALDIRAKVTGIFEDVADTVAGPRLEHYGNPADSFKRIADLWSTYLEIELMPTDVCNLMILLKIARDAGEIPKRDNDVDIIGYAALKQVIGNQARFADDHEDALLF